MLDSVTKGRIDSARNILVGKVPDPKSQVEQITIALIYKFMDDMDRQSEELGGKVTFFAGEFKKYRWSNLLDKRLAGHERLLLYAEGLEKMNTNKNIPQLFRDIFKGVFLPYRDPETLNLFLKEIAGFTYEHSERLGDAFEYLLSVLGTQGDAGQFRTPRHIIDFIAAVVDPQKDQTVLDPACGTAGFLISAFKHILKSNENLTPDERARLMTNFRGYDIAPDMVRLSRANLYLHGFPNPVIHEYDTLTSEERWDERYDIILANPPFMSPKGGIRPHNRFSLQANRSEVLFVDYIAEHLNPGGRAGIIVPEGIIFQSQNAYRKLRKMLVENYLWAVVSLPAGVFNPYSGVKTSILLLDRDIARQSDTVGFFKVENDGFNLGAQRRPIDKNDLSQVFTEINEYQRRLRAKKSVTAGKLKLTHGLIVAKERIAANGDYSLSGERYRVNGERTHAFSLVPLADVCTINPPKSEALSLAPDTLVSFVPMSDLGENRMTFTPKETKRIKDLGTSYTYFADGDVLIAKVTPCFENGKAGIAHNLTNAVGFGSSELYILRPSDRVLAEFIYFCVTHREFRDRAVEQMTGTGGLQRVPKSYVEQFKIPLPPLEVQKEIVAEIEAYQKVIDGARTVLDHYRPHVSIAPDWPMVELGTISEPQYGLSVPLVVEGNGFKIFRMNELVNGRCVDGGAMKTADISRKEFEKYKLAPGDLLFNRTNSFEHVGRTGIFDLEGEYCFASYLIRLTIDHAKADPRYVNAFMNTDSFQTGIKQYASRAIGQSNINAKSLAGYAIPLPPLETQRAIVAEIEAEQRLVAANRELIERFEKKIQAKLAEVWGEANDGK